MLYRTIFQETMDANYYALIDYNILVVQAFVNGEKKESVFRLGDNTFACGRFDREIFDSVAGSNDRIMTKEFDFLP